MLKRKIFLLSIIALFIALMSIAFINVVVEPAVSVGTIDSIVHVNKTGYGTVYLTGQDAALLKEESSYNEYSVKNGTEIVLNVVNESKIFSNWNITDTKKNVISTSEVCKIKLTVNSDLIVNQSYRDPTKDDYGKYMGNSFIISSSKDLISIQKIIEFGKSALTQEIIEEYNNLFSSYSSYKDASVKANFINSNDLFTRVCEGYYYIQHNVSVFGSNFTGIGNASYPFQGVFCGENSGKESQIVLLMNEEEKNGTSYYGLFGYLGDKAIVRNLKVNGSIGITSTSANYSNQKIYAGGLAGYANEPLIYNVNTSSSIAINSNNANVYSGNVIGYMNNFGINSLNYFQTNVSKSNNVVKSKGNIQAGLVCGEASENFSYFEDFEIDATSYDMSLKGEATSYSSNVFIKMGLLCGGIGKSIIENITITHSSSFNIHANINCGNLYIGGMAGYVNATNDVTIGRISFVSSSNTLSSIKGITSSSSSNANIYSGGLFGLVNGNYLKANDSFKSNVKKETIDEKIVYQYSPIFDGEYDIRSIQNGRANYDSTYGKCVTGGIIGKGYFDISGSSDKISEIVITKDGRLSVKSVQSSIASHNSYENAKVNSVQKSDSEHCVTGLFTGLISSSNSKCKLEYINLYSENVSLDATREISSLAMGDISIGLLMGHSFGVNYDNINVYINNSSLDCNSLSYEVKNTYNDTNNSYVGGLVGRFYNDQTSYQMEMKNSSLKGYHWEDGTELGNTLRISSIQNTTPGGGDYRGENYVGGLIGQLYQGSIYNCVYNGSNSEDDYITMRAHENPDSAFCGGLIGHVKATTTYNVNIENNKVYNANVYGEETLDANSTYGNPDIYVGGILGALYCHDYSSTINIINNKVFNTKISSIGYERTNTYAGGISGVFTWKNGTTINLNDNMIYNCDITSNVQASNYNKTQHVNAFAAGVCPSFREVTVYANYNSVIDTKVSAISTKNAFAFGVVGRDNNVDKGTLTDSGRMYVNYNYSNARLSSSSGITNHYGVYKSANTQSNNYYLKENSLLSTTASSGIQLSLSDPVKVTSSYVNLLSNHDTTLSQNANKYHLKLIDGNSSQFSIRNNYQVGYVGTHNSTENVEVWINTNSNNTTNYDDSLSKDELHELGWFLFGIMTIYNDTISSSHICEISEEELSYIGENCEYKFDGTKFVNINLPQDTKDNLNYSQIINNNQYIIDAKLYDNILNVKFKFSVSKIGTFNVHNIFPAFFLDDSTTEIVDNDYVIGEYGKYMLYKVNVTDDKVDYEFIFYPNTKIENDGMVNVKFKDGASSNYLNTELIINLHHNQRKLVGVTFAEYTPPINYHTEEAKRYENPYFLLEANSQLVLIPVYKTINDPNNSLIIDLNYCNYVTFSLDDSSGGTMKANGDLLTGSVSSNIYAITLEDQSTGEITTLTYKIIDEYQVSHDVHNMTYDGILTTSSITSYLFKLTLNNGYGGRFTQFTITIGNNIYNLLDKTSIIWENIEIYNQDNESVLSPNDFSLENNFYKIIIHSNIISGNIEISAIVPRIYEVSFDLQASFISQSNRKKVYVIEEGTSFRSYFSEKLGEINEWVDNQTVYGYVFNGFYLVNEASTIASYGESFDTIYSIENMYISSNISFFARWSFLIELIEAPGTHIKTSFSNSFIQDYYNEKLLKRTIQIPINMNKGYVFTVVKDDYYIGESSVKAYSVSKVEGREVIEDIIVEKYFDNMNLYYISPDSIKGYLIIETSVSNSNFITGENTAVISDEIIPEDGVFTFKYVVNHRNTNDIKSYIYNSGKTDSQSNLALEKDFILKIYRQVYNPETGLIDLSDAFVQQNSELEVYYQKIINGKVVKTIVGNYTIKEENVNYVFLSQFTLMDKKTKAFENETFREFLGNNEMVSEVYYFVLTPPNGYSTFDNNIYNIVLEGGYYNSNESDGFVKGIRSTYDIANKPLENLNLNELRMESSKESAIYSITPTRKTILEEVVNSENLDVKKFKFTDDNTFSLLDICVKNGWIIEGQGVIYLRDDNEKNTIVYSKSSHFTIEKMRLKLGYGKGIVNIYGSNDGITYDLVKEINVSSVDYSFYDINEFANNKYKYFAIDNVSTNQIRLSEIHIMPRDNGLMYEFKDFKANYYTADMNDLNLSFTQTIKNDERHDGKSFMLAVQFKDNMGNIVDDISDVHLSLINEDNDVTFDPLFEDVKGRNVVYFNLSEMLSEFQMTTPYINYFIFSIINSKGYSVYNVQLLEVENVNKPAMGEIRYSFTF